MDRLQAAELVVYVNLPIAFSAKRARAFDQNRLVFGTNDGLLLLRCKSAPCAVHQDHAINLHRNALSPIPPAGLCVAPHTATRSASPYADSVPDFPFAM